MAWNSSKKLALDMDKVNMSGHQDIEEYREKFRESTSVSGLSDFSKQLFIKNI